jgi:hypothetical protein
MSYTIEVFRSPDQSNWTKIDGWTSDGGNFSDFLTDQPGPGTWYYELRIKSTHSADAVSIRRLVLWGGNK